MALPPNNKNVGDTGHVADHNAIVTDVATRALDSAVVHKTGNETVGGKKTFTSVPTYNEFNLVAENYGPLAALNSAGGLPMVTTLPQSVPQVDIPSNASGSLNILTLVRDVVVRFPAASAGRLFRLAIKQDASGGHSLTLPSVAWAGGTAPTLTETPLGADVLTFYSVDGDGWYGFVEGLNMVSEVAGSDYVLDHISQQATAAYSLRQTRQGYSGSAIKVRRSSDGTLQDIGFDDGVLDLAALGSFCGGGSGYIHTWYDQSGNGYHLVNATDSQQYRIFNAGVLETKDGKACAKVVNEVSGYVVTVPLYQGAPKCSAVLVGSINNTVTAGSPRFLSVMPAAWADNDAKGSMLIGRNGGGAPLQSWGEHRNGVYQQQVPTTYGNLDFVASVMDGVYATLFVNSTSVAPSAEVRNFEITRIAMGYTGTAYQSLPGAHISEAYVFFDALTSTNRQVMQQSAADYFAVDPPAAVEGVPYGQSGTWTKIFEDTFTGSVLDTSKWRPTQFWGVGPEYGSTNTGNNEKQWYLPSQVTVSGGNLHLTAQPENLTRSPGGVSRNFTHKSGIVTSGPGYTNTTYNSTALFEFTYGFAEARMKVPKGKGLWSAFWMQRASNTASWPPEIDAMEVLGDQISTTHLHYHYLNAQGVHADSGGSWSGPDLSQDFHIYAIDWTPSAIRWYVDGVERRSPFTDTARIANQPMYLLLNLAVGGNWPGDPDSSTVFPAEVAVDWVRVWQRS